MVIRIKETERSHESSTVCAVLAATNYNCATRRSRLNVHLSQRSLAYNMVQSYCQGS